VIENCISKLMPTKYLKIRLINILTSSKEPKRSISDMDA